jgi:hypothetical protein
MNMPLFGGPNKDDVLSKLVRLADGDTELVNEALRKLSVDGKVDLKKVVDFILARLREGEDAPEQEPGKAA